jgi:hypothetical protein
MAKAFFVLSVFALSLSCLAQSASDGRVIFRNRNIATPQPDPALPGYVPGGNDNGTYNVPIYQHSEIIGEGNSYIGAGTLPGGVTVGLYYQNHLLATTILGTTTASAPFFVTPTSQEVVIRDASGNALAPGSSPVLTIRAWTTVSGSFDAARVDPNGLWGEWTFISPPLGGIPSGSGDEIPVPTLTGWGPIIGTGVTIGLLDPIVWTRINSPVNGSVFAAPATISTTAETFISNGFALTNLALFANGTLVGSQSGSIPTITASTSALAAGSYTFTSVAQGYWNPDTAASYTSTPVNIMVVTPVEISIDAPQISDGEFKFSFTANPGLKYVIKTSADLINWQAIATNTPESNPALFSQPFDPTVPRYYKVERLPNP